MLAEKDKGADIDGKSVAAMADRVLPALTESIRLLDRQDPAEAGNFRNTINVAIEAATHARKGEPSPTMADMTRKITEAIVAA
ncbi:hypothetical protein [Nocardia xishanensis]|uniref:Uncharacterized protein n=1 Tax=Nocardia xishanensis TaxID=238964 RepID=A0ABW7WZ64_9NOCA